MEERANGCSWRACNRIIPRHVYSLLAEIEEQWPVSACLTASMQHMVFGRPASLLITVHGIGWRSPEAHSLKRLGFRETTLDWYEAANRLDSRYQDLQWLEPLESAKDRARFSRFETL